MLNLLFKLLLNFFKYKLPNFFKFFFIKNGNINILTNFIYYFNLLYFFKKSTFFQLKNLVDIVVIDYPGKSYRFLIKFLILSVNLNLRLNLNFCFSEFFPIMSIKSIFHSSNWLEREIWDFYGVYFLFNNDLRRLFLDYGFEGYPFRKDFPLYGYYELFYNQPSGSFSYLNVQINKD